MMFNSADFLVFFPIVTLLYFVIPHKVRHFWLLAASYYFYMCWNPKYALLMATSTIITYLSGVLIEKYHSRRNMWVALSFVSNLSILFFFKYFDFAVTNLNQILTKLDMKIVEPAFDVVLPVGISFYTFQALSYTMDVYRGDIKAQKNLPKYALFVSFFPQLVAGPIERSKNLINQIDERHYFDFVRVRDGLLIMLWGFFEKLVIADRASILVNQVYGNYEQYGSLALVYATILFAIQIYCDFAGYSDIAIGAAKVMGFSLMQNFKQPYFALSIAEFWRRWHISLSTWFRDYLYIPLGGNRCSKIKKYRNLMITFLVSGLWHGASWSFVIWGGVHGFLQIMGDILRPIREKVLGFLHINREAFSHKLLRGFMTFVMVDFCWIFFRAPGAKAALKIIHRMFTADALLGIKEMGLTELNLEVLLVAVCVLIGMSIIRYMGVRPIQWLSKQNFVFRWIVYYALIFAVIIFGAYGATYSASQFIYFQF